MSEQAGSRRSLITIYLICIAGAFVGALAFATIGDWWEHQSDNPAFLLLPVSNVRFWFIPFAALGCAGAAALRGRRHMGLTASATLFVLLCVASTLYWYRAGLRLGSGWTAADLSSVMNEPNAAQLTLGGLTLLAIVFFVFGIRDSLRGREP